MFNFLGSIRSPSTIVAGAHLLTVIDRYPGVGDIAPLETTAGLAPRQTLMAHQSGDHPTFASWRIGDLLIIGIGGVKTTVDSLRFYGGAGSPEALQGLPGVINASVKRAVVSIVEKQLFSVPPAVGRVWVFGHSFGGCIAHTLAQFIKRQFADRDVGSISFGAPRFADATAVRALNRVPHWRVMNHGDVFPFMMPYPLEHPLLAAFAGPAMVQQWAEMVHMDEGLSMGPNGERVYTNTPIGLTPPFTFNAFHFHRLWYSDEYPHRTWIYHERALAAFPPPLQPAIQAEINNTPTPLPDRRHSIPPRVIQEQVRQAQTEIANREALPVEVRDVPSRVKITRFGGAYYVWLDNNPIYLATGRSDARGFANALRAFMRQYTQNPDRLSPPADLLAAFRGEFMGVN